MGYYHFWIPCGQAGNYSHWQLRKHTTLGDYRIFGPTVVDAVGGSSVKVLSSVDSERELVFCRNENGSNVDVEGGHGNVSLDSAISISIDGSDVTSTLAGGGVLSGWSVTVYQDETTYTDEPPSGVPFGDAKLTHVFGAGGIRIVSVVTPSLVTTMTPWAYSVMNPGDRGSFDGYYKMTPGVETYGALSDAILLGQINGMRFVSGSHPYSLGFIQTTPYLANFGWGAATPGFILGDVEKWKGYVMASSEPSPVVLRTGDVWRSESFHFAAPL